jgi:lipopolysaccharide export system protein LptC
MQADRYTRLVNWLKVLLPLTALGLLSTLFLLSRTIDPDAAIPFADKEIQDRLRDQIVTGPFYYGTTASGDQIAFSAETLTTPQGEIGANKAEQIDVVIDLASGTQILLKSDVGHFDIGKDTADLDGNVQVTTSTGYRINSARMIAMMSQLDVRSPGPVQSVGPFGTLDAGSMVLSTPKKDSPAQLVFTNGVKLIYMPKQDEE